LLCDFAIIANQTVINLYRQIPYKISVASHNFRVRSVNRLDSPTVKKSKVKNPLEFPAFFAQEAKTGKSTIISNGFLQQKIMLFGKIPSQNPMEKGATEWALTYTVQS
jgi:hypothetical protein